MCVAHVSTPKRFKVGATNWFADDIVTLPIAHKSNINAISPLMLTIRFAPQVIIKKVLLLMI